MPAHFGIAAQPQAYPSAHLYDNYSMDNMSVDNLDSPYFDDDFEDEDYFDEEDTDMDLYYDEELYDDEDSDLEDDYYGDEILKPRTHRQRYMPAHQTHFYEDVEDEDVDLEEPLPTLHRQSQKGYHLKPRWRHPTRADGLYDLEEEDPAYYVSEREILLARLD